MLAYLNGDYLPLEDARVSAMDRGLLFGDGVYEYIPIFGGKLFRLQQHLERLDRSLAGIQLHVTISHAEWETIFTKLANSIEGEDASIYCQITRGPDKVRKLAFPENPQPTVFAYVYPLEKQSVAKLAEGATAITLDDTRWLSCNIKAITLLANVILQQQAIDRGFDQAILIRDGKAVEGPNSNLFIVKDSTIITPPKDEFILGGVTRDLVLELAEQHDIAFVERDIASDELLSADEVWLTGSSKEILPILSIDEHTIGTGEAGPLWYQIIKLYQDYKLKVSQ
ncbi:MAG: D-amino acid aminotransferase [Legionellales bacterium]|nr:D-amino acid aminotransferase [Legionellales bacterium]|tara:strand:- start:38778 stop:39626 length:849 start_codon:yes stop_codon:yes gene_type:complete